MCGRFTLFAPIPVLCDAFDAQAPEDLAPRYNIAPSQPVLTLRVSPGTDHREFVRTRWGLIPSWAKDPEVGTRLINARSETAHEKPAFRAAFRSRRCLVPANGFYEWRRAERTKQPYFVRMRDGRPFGLAGLWETWENPEGSRTESCAILTTEANAVVSPLHNRMPVIVPPEQYGRWLEPGNAKLDDLKALLTPYPPDPMDAYPVSPRMNRPGVDDPACIVPLA
jgi:putative SOS response-associated peptidase YedK